MGNPIDEIFEKSISTQDNISDLPSSAGLVLFTDNQNNPITLLTTANIRRTAKTKLAEQQEKTKRADLKSITAKIYYKACQCKFRLAIIHYEAVKRLFTTNYKDYITLVWPWYLSVNINDKIPFFCVTRKPSFKAGEKILGPFPTQKSASVFMNILEDVYKLCRKREHVSDGQSCPYMQMDACVGVCAGKISFEEYKQIINEAFSAGAEPETAINNFQIEMQKAAKELQFEGAAGLKKKIDKLSALKKTVYKWTGDLRKLKIVHIDKSFKIKEQGSKKRKQSFAVFVINIFQIIDAGDFLWDNPDVVKSIVNKRLEELPEAGDEDALERFSIVTYFLYRSKPAGEWIKNLKVNIENLKLENPPT
ncbi:MAG: hypothetical protein A2Y10_10825 [Planctomycetes bacterium GWF2_41_51]|nr:MAG: hypothetical protein A2Y10_10825 [Planctomycetes bacterium GWF2_41_51]HBG28461.1 hypothetical protein [Phycisphaerales bacterium]